VVQLNKCWLYKQVAGTYDAVFTSMWVMLITAMIRSVMHTVHLNQNWLNGSGLRYFLRMHSVNFLFFCDLQIRPSIPYEELG
jgi:hypothetical protein